MAIHKKSFVGFVFFFVVFSLNLSLAFGQDKEMAQPLGSQRPLSEILNPDGTLKVGTGVQGSFDPKGFRMATGADGKPRFVPAGANGQGENSPVIAAAGDENWDDQFGSNDITDLVTAITVSGTDVYVGGWFTSIGTIAANRIAKWNGNSWSTLGPGLNGKVWALSMIGGELYVGGEFTQTGDGTAQLLRIAKWDGSTWSALWNGLNGVVYAIAMKGTDVYAGGSFTQTGDGTTELLRVAKWDGSSWSTLGPGLNEAVKAMCVGDTNLYVGGEFTQTGNGALEILRVAKWDGASWSALSSGISGSVYALAVSETEDVYAGGSFFFAGGNLVYNIAKWNGTSWSALGTGMDNTVTAITVSGTDVYVGGYFLQAGSSPANSIAKWNGSSWSALGNGLTDPTEVYMPSVRAIAVGETGIYAGGIFFQAGDYPANYIAKWDGTGWLDLHGGVSNPGYSPWVGALAVSGSDVFVGGFFTEAGDIKANYVAKWNGLTNNWSALGSGVSSVVYAIAVSGTDVYVGGLFTEAGGSPADHIAKWDGESWSALDRGVFPGYVKAIAANETGVYVGGTFTSAGEEGLSTNCIAKWDGDSWSALGSGLDSFVNAIAVSGADVYVGGLFSHADVYPANRIAKWNGSSWSTLGAGVSGGGHPEVSSIAVCGTDVFVGGPFTQAGNVPAACIAKWDTIVADWSDLGTGLDAFPRAMSVIGKELYVGGNFTQAGSSPAANIAKWDIDSRTWSNLGSGTDVGWTGVAVHAVAIGVTGLYIGGNFTLTGGKAANHFGRWFLPLSIISPNGGEVWESRSLHKIIWSTGRSISNVRLYYSTTSGEPFWYLLAIMPNLGSYDWTVRNSISGSCLVRVEDDANGETYDESDDHFRIAGFRVIAPNGGQQWTVGSQQTISWETSGTYPTVAVDYSTDDGSTWTSIASGLANTGSLPWTVLSTPSDLCRIRVSDADGNPYDASDAVFSIVGIVVPTITVTSPNGGETWWGGETYAITWISSGGVGNVMIEYSTDNGSTWTTVAASTANDGIENWPVPSTPSTTCLVRVSETDGSPSDVSDATFSIYVAPTITVTSPNGGESWVLGASHNITWTWTGTLENVAINYSFDGGTTWWYVNPSTPNAGTYAWTIPSTPSASCLVMVNDALHSQYSDTSDAVFSILAAALRKDDLLGTWDGQGVYYRNSDTGAWVKLASPATKITAGDLDGDGIDDLIGLWPGQGGIWVKYSQTGAWAKLSSTAQYIAAGDMNGDGRADLVGTWDGQGVFYRNSLTGAWVKMASPATMVTAGDIDNDGIDDLIGLWPSQGGIWVKYSQTGTWAKLSSTAVHIAAGDMNGDKRDDLLGTWDGQGVYYRDSATGTWVKMASPATLITTGDIDGDEIDDLIGIWPTQGGVWVKYSSDGTWERLSATAVDITAGKMRAAGGGGEAQSEEVLAARPEAAELPLPMGGNEEGPGIAMNRTDLSDRGPGGARFVYLEDINLEPKEEESARLSRVPGPGEAGARCVEQDNLLPQETQRKEKTAEAGIRIRRSS